MIDNIQTFVYENREYVLTGRTANKQKKQGDIQTLYEIRPSDFSDDYKTTRYNKWVLKNDLFLVKDYISNEFNNYYIPTKEISAIAAVSQDGVIGINNSIPWKCSKDMRFFKFITTGGACIMGRKTYESMPQRKNSQVLPNRLNFVLSTQTLQLSNAILVPDKNDIQSFLLDANAINRVYFIGGASIYDISKNYITSLYLTTIKNNYNEGEGDIVTYDFGDIKAKFDGNSTIYEDNELVINKYYINRR